jgi:hypothetical protein
MLRCRCEAAAANACGQSSALLCSVLHRQRDGSAKHAWWAAFRLRAGMRTATEPHNMRSPALCTQRLNLDSVEAVKNTTCANAGVHLSTDSGKLDGAV